MAFNINTFRAGMKYDGQRPNLFEVSIDKVKGSSQEPF